MVVVIRHHHTYTEEEETAEESHFRLLWFIGLHFFLPFLGAENTRHILDDNGNSHGNDGHNTHGQ